MTDTKAFVNRHHIGIRSVLVEKNPHMNGEMPAGSAHWRCTLRCGDKRMTVYYSQGPAIVGEPNAADVLDCLASDAASYESAGSFESWASDYGYDTDSRKAERTYRLIETQAGKLARFVGDSYDDLLYKTQRL